MMNMFYGSTGTRDKNYSRLTSRERADVNTYNKRDPFMMQVPVPGEDFPLIRLVTKYQYGFLFVTLKDAEHLNILANRKINTCVKVQLHKAETNQTEKFQTETDSSKSPNPLFNKTFTFSLKEHEIRDTSLVIQVFDMGYITEEWVGVVHICMTHLWMGEQRVGWKKEERSVEIRPPDGEQGHTLMVLRCAKDGTVSESEEGRMRRKILIQEDQLFKVESANKIKQQELEDMFKEKETIELEVSDLEKKKIDYKFQLQRAETGHTVDVPNITKEVNEEISKKRKELELKKTRLQDVLDKSAELHSKTIDRASNGILKIGLRYKDDTNELFILVDSAKNLPAVNRTDTSDPYVKVTNQLNNELTFLGKTKTLWKELNPSWKEDFTLPDIRSLDQVEKCSLGFVVKDDERIRLGAKNTSLGKVFINMNSAQGAWHFDQLKRGTGAIYLEYPLQI
eukprot:GFUD01014488.1.p1 GENE.GFUD01014488.1~~GFUD01014488.1.p1  ORF type:complete len:452 (+),score=121.42 GFUD01014488.1:89-1444(+)